MDILQFQLTKNLTLNLPSTYSKGSLNDHLHIATSLKWVHNSMSNISCFWYIFIINSSSLTRSHTGVLDGGNHSDNSIPFSNCRYSWDETEY